MYYNIKPVNDENICLGCFKRGHFSDLNSKLLRDYDEIMSDYVRSKILTPVEAHIFKKAVPKSFLKLWEAECAGETVLTVKDCEKLVKIIDKYSSLDDLDIDCLYGCLEWAIDKDVDICIKASDTPFK